MATVLTRPTNGVSYGYVHTVTSGDDSDGSVIIDFQVDYMMSAAIMVLDSSNINLNTTNDLVITFPANGQVKIADGSVLKVVAGYILHIVANRRSA